MKKSIFLLLLIMTTCTYAQDSTTTYFLIRHAEKADSSKDTDLSKEGFERAAKWDHVLQHIAFDAIYCTAYKRTQQTAQRIANRNHNDFILYHPREIDIAKFKKETAGKTVLVVGHSNTLPYLINALTGRQHYSEIDETVFGNLYIVTLKGNSATDYLLQF